MRKSRRKLRKVVNPIIDRKINLIRYKYANIQRIYSETIDLEDSDRKRKGARFVVKLTKSAEFDSLTTNFLK